MAIQFHCPHCQKLLAVRDDYTGRAGTCNGCRGKVLVPQPPDIQNANRLATPPTPFPQIQTSATSRSKARRNNRFRGRPKPIAISSMIAIIVAVGIGAVVYLRHVNRIQIIEWYTRDSLPTPLSSSLKAEGPRSKFLVVTIKAPSTRLGSFSGRNWKPGFEQEHLRILLEHDGSKLMLPAMGGRDVLVGLDPEIERRRSIFEPGFRPGAILVQTVTQAGKVDRTLPITISFFVMVDDAWVTDSSNLRFQFKNEKPIPLPRAKRK